MAETDAAKLVVQLLELHQPAVFTSAPYSRDGEHDDLCCATCGRDKPEWPCTTRTALDALADLLGIVYIPLLSTPGHPPHTVRVDAGAPRDRIHFG